MRHKKTSQSNANNTTNKTNVGPHGASVAKRHAALCEKIQLAMRSRKKIVFGEGEFPLIRPSIRPHRQQVQKHEKTQGVKSSPFLHKKNGQKRRKITLHFLHAATRAFPVDTRCRHTHTASHRGLQ